MRKASGRLRDRTPQVKRGNAPTVRLRFPLCAFGSFVNHFPR